MTVDPQKDIHPFFYPPSFGMCKRKREAEQSIGVAAVPASNEPGRCGNPQTAGRHFQTTTEGPDQ
jgi:hypothetical protein